MGYHALHEFSRSGSAVSSEADAVRRATATVAIAAERSQALFGRKALAVEQLLALESECAEEGWDGHDAVPINPLAVLKAQRFLRALPDRMPLPEFAAEPDGSISLDWMPSRHRLFSVSIGPGDRLAFAWLDGTDSGHGVAFFDGQTVPQPVLVGIELTIGSALVWAYNLIQPIQPIYNCALSYYTSPHGTKRIQT